MEIGGVIQAKPLFRLRVWSCGTPLVVRDVYEYDLLTRLVGDVFRADAEVERESGYMKEELKIVYKDSSGCAVVLTRSGEQPCAEVESDDAQWRDEDRLYWVQWGQSLV